MNMNVFKKLLVAGLFLSLSFSSKAWWGLTGHRVVAEIAESYLSSKARLAIRQILGTESLAMASNWADFIKSDSASSYLSPWHYININSSLDKNEFQAWLQKDTAVDAYTKLNFLVAQLKKKQLSPDKNKMYLRLLIHIIGDIHQPMHIGRVDDQGGNKIKVTWFNDPSNLHSVWDDKLIELQKLSYTEYTHAINHVTKKQVLAWQKQPMTEWFFESYQIAGELYSEITQPDQKLSYRYNYDHLETLNQQLLKAGVRLAGVLNTIFG
jgi:S1/P1 Nuclease